MCMSLRILAELCLHVVFLLQAFGCRSINASVLQKRPEKIFSVRRLAGTCPVPQDIVFLVDSSASVGSARFERVVQRLADVLVALSRPSSRVGIVQFSDDFQVVHALTSDLDKLYLQIQSDMSYIGGETNMGPPLAAAHDLLDTSSQERSLVIVCLTDGNPNDWDATRSSAADIRNDGIRLMFGRLGKSDVKLGKDQFLGEIVSPPVSENIFDFLDASELLARIVVPCPCPAGDLVETIIGDKPVSIELDEALSNGTSRLLSCSDLAEGYRGQVQIQCRAILTAGEGGRLTTYTELRTTNNCQQTCGIDSEASVSVGSTAIIRPSTEISSGDEQERGCAAIFPDTQGTIRLMCLGGTLNATNDCFALPKSNPSCTVYQRALIASAVVNVVLSAIMIWWALRWRKNPIPSKIRSIVPDDKPLKKVLKVDIEMQTDPVMYVEQMRGMQMPLDIVFCVDSSISVDQADFAYAVSFLDEVALHLDMPTICTGLVQFNDQLPFPSIQPLTGSRAVLRESIQGMLDKRTVDMLGETKMADPIRAAADMFTMGSRDAPKVIVMLTDGDPNDLEATLHAAEWAKKYRNIRLFFVHLRSRPKSLSSQNQLGIIEQLLEFQEVH
eukprot:gnl/MRDRNA2_/MRDRNA2_72019_c0_seq1.p1 gnl/MRDRNA2_/MRDRNA2_72019_c0~~gnl/MRDRNA2_/MRDRNA2_72019_c0_seq1.p1  ORF type:complete len:614 (-),score=113.05 gnl/MRDRNA2_/MRDRNA2_72019_c0_seq1:469-2310(-)